jgi:hypothetical protein
MPCVTSGPTTLTLRTMQMKPTMFPYFYFKKPSGLGPIFWEGCINDHNLGPLYTVAELNIFFGICTHTQTITINGDPCPPMLFKLRPCIQKLCNVYYSSTPSIGWIGQIKGRSLLLASVRSASWLAYSLHPRSLTPIWSLDAGMHKTDAHPCPPKTHGHGHGYKHPM